MKRYLKEFLVDMVVAAALTGTMLGVYVFINRTTPAYNYKSSATFPQHVSESLMPVLPDGR